MDSLTLPPQTVNGTASSIPTPEASAHCLYCPEPLEAPKAATCWKHRMCRDCGAPLDGAELFSCISQNPPELPIHARCYLLSMPRESEDTVRVSRAHFEKLNLARLIVTPERGMNEETNVNTAGLKMNSWIVGMSVQEQFLLMRRLEACAAEISYVIGKSRSEIKAQLQKEYENRVKGAREYRETAPKVLKTQAAKLAETQTPGNPSEPKEKLTPRGKLMAKLMKMGLSMADADSQITAMGF